MKASDPALTSRQTLLLILLPLLASVVGLRLYLHLVQVRQIYPAGFLIHHLFTGLLLVLPSAFLLAFGPRTRTSAVLARVALGTGSGMILDEIVFLVATKAADADYVSTLSLHGAMVFVAAAVVLLLSLYFCRIPRPSAARPSEP